MKEGDYCIFCIFVFLFYAESYKRYMGYKVFGDRTGGIFYREVTIRTFGH
jgi:hypothetical protein